MGDDLFGSDEPVVEETPQANPGSGTDWEQEAKKAFAERDKARNESRRMAIQGEFGAQIAELIPETLPPSEWKGYAEKLAALRGEVAPNQAEEAKPEVASETAPPADELATEARLATVAGQAPAGVQSSTAEPSAQELYATYQSDPAEATRRAIAKYRDKV